MKNLLQISDLSLEKIHKIFETAKKFASSPQNDAHQKLVVGLFYENSTRTKFSFEMATKRLGGAFHSFSLPSSATIKGESLLDTLKNLEALGADCFVLRHYHSGVATFLSKHIKTPIINAGDGIHQHPSQALLDCYTLVQKWGSLSNKKILILGDIAHSRVARSNIDLMSMLGAKISVCGPPTLLPRFLLDSKIKVFDNVEEAIFNQDAIMVLRIQKERMGGVHFSTLTEYTKFWGLTQSHQNKMKPGCFILHPGPINKGVEIDLSLTESDQSLILEQVKNGVLIRMAILSLIFKSKATQ